MDENNSVPEMTMEERVRVAIYNAAINKIVFDGTCSFSQYGGDSFVDIVLNPECVREKAQIDNLVETILSCIPDLDRENELYSEPSFSSFSGFYWDVQFSLWKTWKKKDGDDHPYSRSGIIRVSILPDCKVPMRSFYVCVSTSMWKKVMKYFTK